MRMAPLTVVALLAASAAAQAFFIPSDTPSVGTSNAFPFNTSDMRYQALVRASELGGTPALIRGFALAPGASANLQFGHVTMKMAPLAAATLSTTFDANLAAGATTTMDLANFVWPVVGNVWNEIDLQTPFFFNGIDNVVVEFVVTGRVTGVAMRRDATNQRIYQGSYTGQTTGTDGGQTAFKMRLLTGNASTAVFGRGCVGSNALTPTLGFSGTAQLGTSLGIDLSNGAANSLALLSIGFDNLFPFPLDLGAYGLPGCTAYLNSIATNSAFTSPSGSATVAIAIPNFPAFVGITLYTQWIAIDPGLATGVTTSNYGRALVGN